VRPRCIEMTKARTVKTTAIQNSERRSRRARRGGDGSVARPINVALRFITAKLAVPRGQAGSFHAMSPKGALVPAIVAIAIVVVLLWL
jgi:hypothetical protein